MKWSIFTFVVKNEDNVVIYNTLTGEVVSLKTKIYNNILDDDCSFVEIKEYLKKAEIIIDKDINEKEKFMNAITDEWNNCGFLSLHILTTTGCNFRCPYCYQSGIDINSLTNEKVKTILLYIENYISKNKIKESSVEITGGEPTTNWGVVQDLLEGLDKIFKKNKIRYKTYIVTNGYNFTSEKVDLIAKYNWKRLQITLDGPPTVHDKRRILANGDGTFEKIVDNLSYIINNKKIKKINLRINYDKSNIDYIPVFLEYIKKKFGTKKILISLGLITKTVNCSEVNGFIELNGIQENGFFDNYINLYKKAISLGFSMTDIFSFDGMCTAKIKHGFIIQPNGDIVKCVSGVGRKEFIIDNIKNMSENHKNYFFEELYRDCLNKECQFLPICHTGCRFESLIKNRDVRKNVCKRELLERINKEIIKINYMK